MHKAHDIFQKIRERQIVGMMLHQQMADYYDFLDLHGFKRLHEIQYYMEAGNERRVSRYYINAMGEILDGGHPGNPQAIPSNWSGRNRRDVGKANRPEYVRSAMAKWVSWEQETKDLYQQCYKELMDLDEVAAAKFVGDLICDVDKELKKADRLYLKLEGMGYDMPAVFLMQDELHEKYKRKTRKVGEAYC